MTVRLSSIDKSTLVVTFKHDTLAKGKCYKMKFNENAIGFKVDEQLFKN